MEKTLVSNKKFEGAINHEVNALYVRVYLANQRQGTAKTKTRAEVSGGGVKPFKQKGTGRARSGSRRSPVYVHGGISHGPVPKSWSLTLTSGVKKVALKSALSVKSEQKTLTSVKDFNFSKTKEVAALLKDMNVSGTILIITEAHDVKAFRAARNIKLVTVKSANNVNAYDILNAKNVIATDAAVKVLEKRI